MRRDYVINFNGFGALLDLESESVRASQAEISRMAQIAGFDVMRFWNRRWEYPYLMGIFRHSRPGSVLDAGAGKSLLPFWLIQEGCKVTALDIDDGSFYPEGSLREWYRTTGNALGTNAPDFVQGDIRRNGLSEELFDGVFSMSVFEHLDDPIAAARECLRVLRPGGIFAFTADISLDDSREMKKRTLHEVLSAIEPVAYDAFPIRELRIREMFRTDWFRRNEPRALPWAPRRRSPRERANNLLKGRFALIGPKDDGFDTMSLVGYAFLKR